MDFMFSDIGRSFVSMIQQDIPKEILSNTNNGGTQKQAFADHLNKQLEKANPPGISSPSQSGAAVLQAGQESVLKSPSLLEDLYQEEGINFITALKNFFLKLSKGDLKNFSIDAGGLEALKKMLLTAGFKETDINEIFSELMGKTKTGKLALADLMSKLSDLSLEENLGGKTPSETFLEISALPFLESILNSLGVKPGEIQKIMAEADKGEKGISLDVIIEKLKGLQKNSYFAQEPIKTIESDRNYQHLLKQLGMEQAGEKTSPLSLNEFMDALETLRKKLSQERTANKGLGISDPQNPEKSSEKSSDLLSALFKGIEQLKQPEKTSVFGFSLDQIKNQFENRMLLPDDRNTGGNTLFAANKDVMQGTDSKQKELNKNFEVFLNQKKNSDMDLAGLPKEVKGVFKQLKSENSKFVDQLQVSGTDTKTQDLQSGTNVLRAKPSLKDLPTYVTHQVSKSLVRAINQGENSLRIQLKPPELGRLLMTIDNTGNNMKISIITDNQAAKDILVSNMNDIRTALSNSGVTLERFDVDMNSNFQQSMADARNQAGNSGKRQQNRERLLVDPVTGMSMNDPTGVLKALNLDGSLHYIA